MADEGLFGGGAAFGVFPQMGGRRRLQDPQASADVPFQALRGSFAGLLGILPDVANFLGRSPMPTETLGEFDYGPRQQIPYGSEFYLKELPLAPTSPVGQLAGQVGSFAPLSPMPAVRGAQTVGRMVGQRMAENVAMGRPSLPSMLAEPRASLFAVEPSPMMPKPQAQVSELGFYSAAEQAAMNLPRNKGTGQSFLNDLMKAPDVKKDELAWTGVDDFLANKPNVTKQEVQDFIANNRVDVQERQLGGALSPEMQTTRDALSDKYKGLVDNIADAKSQFEEGKISYAQVRDTVSNNQVQIQALDTQINEINKTISPTKYERYQLPGGENYREILLTLPKQSPTTNDIASKLFGKEMRFLSEAEKDAVVAEARRIEDTTPKDYVSSHFNEPNILAHIRVNDRVDADGKKMLLIEEIQSDWHQAGREKGYKTGKERNPAQVEKELTITTQKRSRLIDEAAALPDSEMTKFKAMNEEIKVLGEQATKLNDEWTNLLNKPEGVPDAPFKDTWYQLALKRVLKHAADNGYERVGLTTGKQQADRYKMSNEVNSLAWRDAGGGVKRAISLELVNGDNMTLSINNEGKVMGGNFEDKSLSSVLGKDLAKKIMAEDNGNLMGNGLNIGGEGMKKYYDEVYPQYLDKYGKKWNAKVGETQISTGDNAWNMAEQIKMRGISDAQWRAMSEADKLTLWNEIKKSEGKTQESIRYIDITPEMKGAVSKGQPLFAAVPVGSIGLGYQKDKADNLEETSPMYSDPFGNTIGSSIR